VTSSGVQSLVMGYLTFYLTENVMLSAAIVSAIIASARVFDGISDIIAGLIIDKTHTKIGKARPLFHFYIADVAVYGACFFCTGYVHSGEGHICRCFL
jgi:GPH family glycoside/pentoside/hexuronide:cation symporter